MRNFPFCLIVFVLVLGTLSVACTDKGSAQGVVSDIFIKNETSQLAEIDFWGVKRLDNSRLVVLLDSGETYKLSKNGSFQDFDPFPYIHADSVKITFNDTLMVEYNILESDCTKDTLNPLCPDSWNYLEINQNAYYSTEYVIHNELYDLAE